MHNVYMALDNNKDDLVSWIMDLLQPDESVALNTI